MKKEFESFTSKEDIKFLYEKAIQGRQQIWNDFNHWMNMYAIFNGALFVGFYSIMEKNPDCSNPWNLCEFLIITLGCIEAILWHCSARSFYRWIKSWIGVVALYESMLTANPVYRAFVYLEKKEDAHPFSTQKLTLCFTFSVAVAWGLLVINFFVKNIIRQSIAVIPLYIYIIIILIVSFLLFSFLSKNGKSREDLMKSHFHILHKDYAEFEQTTPNGE